MLVQLPLRLLISIRMTTWQATVILLILGVVHIFAQSPDDHDPSCRRGLINGPKHIFPDTWELLLDTHDYTSLFKAYAGFEPVWKCKSFDGDSNQV